MSINERQYMRSNEDDSPRNVPAPPRTRPGSRDSGSIPDYSFSRSEQVGLVLAGFVIVALLLAAIL
ncbi:MAG: hypothetical protein VYD99_06055 [Planctomycetota bacterium]|nr:hypothetical protein [Planctomycetota bacterium]